MWVFDVSVDFRFGVPRQELCAWDCLLLLSFADWVRVGGAHLTRCRTWQCMGAT